jgi:hypothetical protein
VGSAAVVVATGANVVMLLFVVVVFVVFGGVEVVEDLLGVGVADVLDVLKVVEDTLVVVAPPDPWRHWEYHGLLYTHVHPGTQSVGPV